VFGRAWALAESLTPGADGARRARWRNRGNGLALGRGPRPGRGCGPRPAAL